MEYTLIYPKLPDKKYDIIYSDPPWRYDGCAFNSKTGKDHSVKDQYPTLGLEELAQLPIQNICKDNCLMFLWATSPKLDMAMDIIPLWGFKYINIAFVWEKVHCLSGHYTLPSTEIVLTCKKGRIPKPRGSRNERQFLQEKRTVHSRKPVEIRKRIERMFPTQSKIELFSRRPSDDQWNVWGNQCENSNNATSTSTTTNDAPLLQFIK